VSRDSGVPSLGNDWSKVHPASHLELQCAGGCLNCRVFRVWRI
jgi:hypothetical protein